LCIICGIEAKLEMYDTYGNLIVMDTMQNEADKINLEIPKDKMMVFTQNDVMLFLCSTHSLKALKGYPKDLTNTNR
jgi:hypothetical protein